MSYNIAREIITNVNGEDITVHRVDNDINGNPRFVIHFLTLGLKDYEATRKTVEYGLSKYRAKWYGGGFVFSSYNLKDSLEWILEGLK